MKAGRVGDLAEVDLVRHAFEGVALLWMPDQRAHPRAAAFEPVHEMASQVTGRAGDEYSLHSSCRMPPSGYAAWATIGFVREAEYSGAGLYELR